MKKQTQAGKILQLWLDGETITPRKALVELKISSYGAPLKKAEIELNKMGFRIKRWKPKVRGGKRPMHYKMEMV
jgi:hypothetical protein